MRWATSTWEHQAAVQGDSSTVQCCGVRDARLLVLSPWQLVRRHGWLEDHCPCLTRCEECQVLWWGAGSWVGLLKAEEFGFPGCSANFVRFPNLSVLRERFYSYSTYTSTQIDVFIHYLFLIPKNKQTKKKTAGYGKHWGTVPSLWYISQNLLFCEAAGWVFRILHLIAGGGKSLVLLYINAKSPACITPWL